MIPEEVLTLKLVVSREPSTIFSGFNWVRSEPLPTNLDAVMIPAEVLTLKLDVVTVPSTIFSGFNWVRLEPIPEKCPDVTIPVNLAFPDWSIKDPVSVPAPPWLNPTWKRWLGLASPSVNPTPILPEVFRFPERFNDVPVIELPTIDPFTLKSPPI